jgi:hypothetical protein
MSASAYKKGGPLFPDPRGISEKKAREGAAVLHSNPQRAFQVGLKCVYKISPFSCDAHYVVLCSFSLNF